jgi:hypothetical protein
MVDAQDKRRVRRFGHLLPGLISIPISTLAGIAGIPPPEVRSQRDFQNEIDKCDTIYFPEQ